MLKRFDTITGMIKIYFITETNKGDIKIYFGAKATQTASRGKYETSSCTILPCAPRISVFYVFREPYAVEWILQMSVTASIRFRTGCIEKRDTQVGRRQTCGEETGIVLASTWLETLELSLSREWRPCTAHTFRSAGSATAILLTASPSGCLRHLFQICRIQFTPVTLCACVFSERFSHPLSSILSFSSPLLPYCRRCPSLLLASVFRRHSLEIRGSVCVNDSHKKRFTKRYTKRI